MVQDVNSEVESNLPGIVLCNIFACKLLVPLILHLEMLLSTEDGCVATNKTGLYVTKASLPCSSKCFRSELDEG